MPEGSVSAFHNVIVCNIRMMRLQTVYKILRTYILSTFACDIIYGFKSVIIQYIWDVKYFLFRLKNIYA